MVTVLFFAQLREQLNCEQLTLNLETPLTFIQLRQKLVELHPQWNSFLDKDKLLFAHNQTIAKPTQLICDGDEVAFFPPVTGG